MSPRPRLLFVTGMAGAGRTTALKTLEDLGWETVDNLPLALLERLLATAPAPAAAGDRPLALGIDARTRGFDAQALLARIERLGGESIETALLFLDCSSAELVRRFSGTRRRHPLALDREAADGIARERELLDPVRRAATHLVDTTDLSTNALQAELRVRFADAEAAPTLTLLSFSYARGLPRSADLVFDVRFLRNPHWDAALRPCTGLDPAVGAYVAADPAYEAVTRIEELIALLLPRYALEGKSYVTLAFGCTGGRHRSVHVAERVAARLRESGFSPTVFHRDLPAAAHDSVAGRLPAGNADGSGS